MAAILAKPLLWATLDASYAAMVLDSICTRILNALHDAGERINIPAGENCVEKVLTIASEHQGEVSFTEVPSEYAAVGGREVVQLQRGQMLNGRI